MELIGNVPPERRLAAVDDASAREKEIISRAEMLISSRATLQDFSHLAPCPPATPPSGPRRLAPLRYAGNAQDWCR
jgi:hypothetical protein